MHRQMMVSLLVTFFLVVMTAGLVHATVVVSYNAAQATANLWPTKPAATNLDLDGDSSIDDSRTQRAFTGPDGTAWAAPGPDYTGPAVFGGVIGEALNLTNKQFDDYSFSSAGLNIRYQTNGTGQSGRFHVVVIFQASESGLLFDTGAGGTSYMRIAGTGSGGNLYRFENLGDVRWLVRNGTTYYVSQTTIVNNTTGGRVLDATELDSESWAVYDPASAFDFTLSLNFNTPTSALTNMNAFGLIAYKSEYTAVRHWIQFTEFEVNAIPEPTTAGLLLVALVAHRIRRRYLGARQPTG